ncbi:MAG TPA: tetratricopeptide repeat protein, partial [Myxococcaceae bacterium]|nr:tetratricopeptide repeat protein [Myxococcaceae bacterium]
QAEKQKSDSHASTLASRQASEVYKQMTQASGDERLKAVDELVKLDQAKLSSLERQALADRAAILRKEIGQTSLERGKAAFRKSEPQQAISELSRFLAMSPGAEEGTEASLLLGAAYQQVHKPDQAIPLLLKVINADKRARQRDYAMLLLATSYDEAGQHDKAADTARDAIGSYPDSQYLGPLKTRLTVAKRQMAALAADGGTTAPQAPAPKPGQAPEAARPTLKPGAAPLPAQ